MSVGSPEMEMEVSKMNRRQRTMMMKNYLKGRQVPVYNADGTLAYMTNEYRQMRRKEGNFKVWFERVQRSQEAGREMHKRHTEEVYNKLYNKKTVNLEDLDVLNLNKDVK